MVAKETMMPAPRKYLDELRDRAVRMVREDGQHGAIARVADRLDINRETLRNWVKGERRRRDEPVRVHGSYVQRCRRCRRR
jgi:transposase-like protein